MKPRVVPHNYIGGVTFVHMPRPFLRKVTRERAAAVFVKIRTYTYVALASLPFKRTDRSLYRLPLADRRCPDRAGWR